MTKEKKLRIVAHIVMFSVYIPLLYGMFASWKSPVIFDGDYSLLGAGYVVMWILSTICASFLYRERGMPHFKSMYLTYKSNRQHKKLVLKLVLSFIVCAVLFYLAAKAIVYPTIASKRDNISTDIIFLITDVRRESYTQTLNRVEGFSYLHNKEIRFPWNKKHIDRSWIYTCVMLKTDGNQWGKMIRSIEKIPRYRCPDINSE